MQKNMEYCHKKIVIKQEAFHLEFQIGQVLYDKLAKSNKLDSFHSFLNYHQMTLAYLLKLEFGCP